MRVTALKVFARVLVCGLLLGVSSTAYADPMVITSFSVSNLQFNPATGTAVFTPTGASARANASNSLGATQDNVSNTFPFAQTSAAVAFASAFGSANAATTSVSGITLASVGACACTAAAFSISNFTGTLVITGGQGNVDVTISGLVTLLRQVETDQFGVLAESEVLFDIFVNGLSVFSVESLIPLNGPNQFAFVEGTNQLSRVITLQFGAENTIGVRLLPRSLLVNTVPEPATVVLLASGLGFMTGVLKKRRKTHKFFHR